MIVGRERLAKRWKLPRRFERLGWWRTAWANWSFRRAYRRRGLAACQEIYARYYAASRLTFRGTESES